MKILATVLFGKTQATATWECIPTDVSAYLCLNEDQEGNHIVVKLNPKCIREIEKGQNVYVGIVDSAEAYVLKKG